MRLNVTLERPNLFTYMKLGYSKLGSVVDELDYADASLTKTVTFSNV